MGTSISDLRGAQPADATLQNLLGVLSAKLELCSRLPIYEYEAGNEGHELPAAAFRRLAEIERQSFNDLLECLHRHLDDTAGQPREVEAPPSAGIPAGGRR